MQPAADITLEQAQELVSLLEQGDQEGANNLLEQLSHQHFSDELFSEVGKLTRQLHDSLADFQLDPRIGDLATQEIPDAKQRLTYVMEKTEEAANRTMDAVEASLPIADRLSDKLSVIQPQWQKLMNRNLALGEFKTLCHELNDFIAASQSDSDELRSMLTQILMAQDFQDLTGQVIRKVIDLVREVEESLIRLLTVFAPEDISEETAKQRLEDATLAEGPVVASVNQERVVAGQDEVDDLLSSLGF